MVRRDASTLRPKGWPYTMSDDESTSTRSEELDELLGTLTTEAPDDAQVDALIQSLLKATEDAVQHHEMELAAALEGNDKVPPEGTSTSGEAPPKELVSATQRRQLVLLSESPMPSHRRNRRRQRLRRTSLRRSRSTLSRNPNAVGDSG